MVSRRDLSASEGQAGAGGLSDCEAQTGQRMAERSLGLLTWLVLTLDLLVNRAI